MNGIWIRSQNGTILSHVSAVWCGNMGTLPCEIHGTVNSEMEVVLGTYPTEARAAEVMDEIDKFKSGKFVVRTYMYKCAFLDDVEMPCYADPATDTYKMPKE